jgi:hypothetical protein
MIWFLFAVAVLTTAHTWRTYRRYSRAGLITGTRLVDKVTSYIQAANLEIDLKRAARDEGLKRLARDMQGRYR